MDKQLLVYMTPWCPDCRHVQEALAEWGVPARYVNISRDPAAAARVRALTGFESVPTLVAVDGDGFDPIEPPAALPAQRGPRGLDRGSVITEPSTDQLRAWLIKHGWLKSK
ncbi:MAG: glutaredoxin family protein [Anaerolineae bacterium]